MAPQWLQHACTNAWSVENVMPAMAQHLESVAGFKAGPDGARGEQLSS